MGRFKAEKIEKVGGILHKHFIEYITRSSGRKLVLSQLERGMKTSFRNTSEKYQLCFGASNVSRTIVLQWKS